MVRKMDKKLKKKLGKMWGVFLKRIHSKQEKMRFCKKSWLVKWAKWALIETFDLLEWRYDEFPLIKASGNLQDKASFLHQHLETAI